MPKRSNEQEVVMNSSIIDTKRTYSEFLSELRVCKIGGLFLALYDNEKVPEVIIDQLKKDLPDNFIFTLHMDEEKVWFPTFFEQTYLQLGTKSNIFHVLDVDKLSETLRSDFFEYLQYARERFKSKPYSLIFWIPPNFERELFLAAPDFYHWVFGTYDFTKLHDVNEIETLESLSLDESNHLENIDNYLKNVIWQYEQWQEVKDSNEDFLIDVMERSNLNDYYVKSYCIDKDDNIVLLDDLLYEFLTDDKKNFLTLLGDFGTGKTSFSIHYFIFHAKKYLNKETERIPIFISLKNYPGKLNIESFILKEFYELFNISLFFANFQDLSLKGKFFFIIDGFDEMASLSAKVITEENFKELTKLTFENLLFMTKKSGVRHNANKVFLTCRTHYFFTDIQEREILQADYTIIYRNYATKSNYEITRINLKEFDDNQIEEYIYKNTNNKETTKEILEIIKNTYNLEELSTRPILLKMIIETLPTLKVQKIINAASLYKVYTNNWIEWDDWRSQMTSEGKRVFMWKLAVKMFEKGGDFSLHYTKLDRPEENYLKKDIKIEDSDYYKYETTTCSFLNRSSEGNYKFIHKSFMEYFLAEYYFNHIVVHRNIKFEYHKLNKEIKIFLKYLISYENNMNCLDFSVINFTKIDLSEIELTNIKLKRADLRLGNFYNTDLRQANLSGATLIRANLVGANLNGVNLSGACLYKAKLNEIRLNGANLYKAYLRNTDLSGLDLRGTILSETDLSMADLRIADLSKAEMTSAYLKEANLYKANLSEANLCRAELTGANLSEANLREANLTEAYICEAILVKSNLSKAILCNANLSESDLSGADLSGADLSGADLSNTNLSEAIVEKNQLEKAIRW